MEYNLESEALKYETFINRFFRFNKRIKRGHKSELINLRRLAENNSKSALEKSLNEVKKRIDRAFEIFYSLEVTEQEKIWITILQSENAQIETIDDLVKLVNKGLELSIRFK